MHIANNPLHYPPAKSIARSSWLRSQPLNSAPRQHISAHSPRKKLAHSPNSNKTSSLRTAQRCESLPSGQLLDSLYPLAACASYPSAAMLSTASTINEVEAATQLLESTWQFGEQFGVGSALPVSMGAAELDDVTIGGFACTTPPTPNEPTGSF